MFYGLSIPNNVLMLEHPQKLISIQLRGDVNNMKTEPRAYADDKLRRLGVKIHFKIIGTITRILIKDSL